MRKICIALSKGGVAKSSTTISIAHQLSILGNRVLIIDTDDQGQDAFMLGVKPTKGLSDVLAEKVSILDAIYEARSNLWILAGSRKIAETKRNICSQEGRSDLFLTKILNSIEGYFDFVIIDTSPSWDALTINALIYCHEVLIPVSLEMLTLNSLAEFTSRVKDVQQINKKLKINYIVPTFFDKRVKKSKEILELLTKYYQQIICEPIRYNVKLSEANGFGQTIFEFAPNSSSSIDYKKLVERIVNE